MTPGKGKQSDTLLPAKRFQKDMDIPVFPVFPVDVLIVLPAKDPSGLIPAAVYFPAPEMGTAAKAAGESLSRQAHP